VREVKENKISGMQEVDQDGLVLLTSEATHSSVGWVCGESSELIEPQLEAKGDSRTMSDPPVEVPPPGTSPGDVGQLRKEDVSSSSGAIGVHAETEPVVGATAETDVC
jgi:hypothetical protein